MIKSERREQKSKRRVEKARLHSNRKSIFLLEQALGMKAKSKR